jgi:hypothetical protein
MFSVNFPLQLKIHALIELYVGMMYEATQLAFEFWTEK